MPVSVELILSILRILRILAFGRDFVYIKGYFITLVVECTQSIHGFILGMESL